MKNAEIKDPNFRKAVEAIDAGDIVTLKELLDLHPELITERLSYPDGHYFNNPYLFWFVADNPIRMGKLPVNIVDITRLIIHYVKQNDTINSQLQLDYTLALIVTGHIPKQCGVQIEMIDFLLDNGATLKSIMSAVTNRNIEAAKHLISRGAELNLAGAVCIGSKDDIARLALTANPEEKFTALAVAAFYGKFETVAYLLNIGANPNGYPTAESGFHSHATPLHQAVSACSLNSVKLLVKWGASTSAVDNIYNGTPLTWAEYLLQEENDQTIKNNLVLIADYLRDKTTDE